MVPMMIWQKEPKKWIPIHMLPTGGTFLARDVIMLTRNRSTGAARAMILTSTFPDEVTYSLYKKGGGGYV